MNASNKWPLETIRYRIGVWLKLLWSANKKIFNLYELFSKRSWMKRRNVNTTVAAAFLLYVFESERRWLQDSDSWSCSSSLHPNPHAPKSVSRLSLQERHVVTKTQGSAHWERNSFHFLTSMTYWVSESFVFVDFIVLPTNYWSISLKCFVSTYVGEVLWSDDKIFCAYIVLSLSAKT